MIIDNKIVLFYDKVRVYVCLIIEIDMCIDFLGVKFCFCSWFNLIGLLNIFMMNLYKLFFVMLMLY